jgi:hypothetical protein
MNSLNTVYFPATHLYSIRQYPIFLLFQKIHLIQPVEDDPADSGKEPTDSFINSGFCQVHTPCPLGDNRDRFLNLVNDIRGRRDDYAAQLSSLTLASMSGGNSSGEDSEQDIINSLLTPRNLEEESKKEEREEKLWQARLVLAIGEILDSEEEEIARNLAMLEDDQAGLFKELHGDGESSDADSPFEDLLQVESNLGSAHFGNAKKRFKAWKTLFLEGDMKEYEIFLTTSQDAGDLLLESYEKQTGIPAPLIGKLELPGLIGRDGSEALQTVEIFAAKNSRLLSDFYDILARLFSKAEITEEDIGDNTALDALCGQWREELEVDFPVARFGRIPVQIFLFPSNTCSTLIGKTSSGTGKPANGLLIVVD